jgi:hypothetical protein
MGDQKMGTAALGANNSGEQAKNLQRAGGNSEIAMKVRSSIPSSKRVTHGHYLFTTPVLTRRRTIKQYNNLWTQG